jgi:uncharacterized protein YuzE
MKTKWIEEQKQEAKRFYAPSIFYDEEYDILSILWCPQLKIKESVETSNGFIFDLDNKNQVTGIEITEFKSKLKKETKNIN